MNPERETALVKREALESEAHGAPWPLAIHQMQFEEGSTLRERRAAYEAQLAADTNAEAQPKLKPVADVPKVSLKSIQSAYAESAAAVNSSRMCTALPKQASVEPPPTEELLETILQRVANGSTS